MFFDYQLKAVLCAWIVIMSVTIFLIARDKKASDLIKVFQMSLTVFLPILGVLIVLLMTGVDNYGGK